MTYVQDYSFYEVMSNMKKYCKNRALAAVFLFFFLAGLPAIDYFAEGERLFRQNRPEEAIPLLYQASLQEGTDPRVFVFLGLSYQQAGKNADAVSTFIREPRLREPTGRFCTLTREMYIFPRRHIQKRLPCTPAHWKMIPRSRRRTCTGRMHG